MERRVHITHSLLCVGLDPHPNDLPQANADAALDFCVRLVRETSRYAAAYKPNAAFFELYGPEGWAALKRVIEVVQEESHRTGSLTPVILDAKRGDIASTAEAYARSAFEKLGAHAITLSPYLGEDSLAPFLADRERGVFLLCKTSNPGAGDVQDLKLADGRTVYEQVALLAQQWNRNGNVGLVVGATQPEALSHVRALSPDVWLLAPGIGAQGGDLETALRAGLRADGAGMLIPVSRAISRAANWNRAAAEWRDAIERMRHAMTAGRRPQTAVSRPRSAVVGLAQALVDSQCVRFGSFTLKSGLQSPIYLDLRRLISHPPILKLAARAYAGVLAGLRFDRLAGLPYAALPIGTAVALEMNRPLLYPRREVKDYGTKAAIEGDYAAGETVVVLDDLATTGDTKLEAIQKLEAAGLKVRDIVVLIDREQGAREALAAAGYTLHAVTTLRELLALWRESGAVTAAQYDEVMAFLAG
ncbi:MAG: orotidine-5'-phosphate decarboxylase [Anaerolineales bacterium]|nr:orotidine-5'-phosphate decarboxylase [Anaerolineales bacterium]